MRGAVVALSTLVVVACSQSYGDAQGSSPDGGTTTDGAATGDVEVTPAELDFGSAECGASSSAQILVLRNRGSSKATYRLQLPDGAAFEVQGTLEGELAPDSVTAVNVVAKPTLAGENTSSVIVTAGATVAQVPLKAKGDGGKLEINPSGVDLGGVRSANGGSIDVSFVNTGTKAFGISSIDSSLADFSAEWTGKPAALTLEPNVPQNVKVRLAAGADSSVLNAELVAKVNGPLCGKIPVLPVRGQRVTNDVTVSSVDFGNVTCKSSPTLTRDVVIANYSSSNLAYGASLDSGASSAFTILSGATGSVGPGTSQTPTTVSVKLGMKTVSATIGTIAEKLSIDITGIAPPAGGKRTADLGGSVHGVVLTANPTDLPGFNRGQYKSSNISNAGNDDANITITYVRDSNTTQLGAWYNQFPTTLAPGAQKPAAIQFYPAFDDHGTYAGTFTMNAAGLCNGPVTVHVSGTY